MSSKVDFEVVRTSPFAAELTDDQCKVLAGIVETRVLKDGEMLLEEGHIDDCVYVVTRGSLAVVIKTDDDDEELLHTLRPGEIAGAMGFVDGMEHSASLRSVGECEVFSLSRSKLEGLIKTQPMIVYRVMRALIRCVHAIVRRMNTQYIQMTNYITKVRGRY